VAGVIAPPQLLGEGAAVAQAVFMVCVRIAHQLDHAAHLAEGLARHDAVGPPQRAQERPAFRGVGLVHTVPSCEAGVRTVLAQCRTAARIAA